MKRNPGKRSITLRKPNAHNHERLNPTCYHDNRSQRGCSTCDQIRVDSAGHVATHDSSSSISDASLDLVEAHLIKEGTSESGSGRAPVISGTSARRGRFQHIVQRVDLESAHEFRIHTSNRIAQESRKTALEKLRGDAATRAQIQLDPIDRSLARRAAVFGAASVRFKQIIALYKDLNFLIKLDPVQSEDPTPIDIIHGHPLPVTEDYLPAADMRRSTTPPAVDTATPDPAAEFIPAVNVQAAGMEVIQVRLTDAVITIPAGAANLQVGYAYTMRVVVEPASVGQSPKVIACTRTTRQF